MVDQGPIHFKVCLIGDASVGKTSIALRYVKNEFKEGESATVGSSFLTKRIDRTFNNVPCQVVFELWDTAGQERFNTIQPLYYRDSCICFIVFALNDMESFTKVQKWMNEILEVWKTEKRTPRGQTKRIVLVGNKKDLPDAQKVVYPANVASFLGIYQEYNVQYFETSAKLNEDGGIPNMFDNVLQVLLSEYVPEIPTEKVILTDSHQPPKTGLATNSCC